MANRDARVKVPWVLTQTERAALARYARNCEPDLECEEEKATNIEAKQILERILSDALSDVVTGYISTATEDTEDFTP